MSVCETENGEHVDDRTQAGRSNRPFAHKSANRCHTFEASVSEPLAGWGKYLNHHIHAVDKRAHLNALLVLPLFFFALGLLLPLLYAAETVTESRTLNAAKQSNKLCFDAN